MYLRNIKNETIIFLGGFITTHTHIFYNTLCIIYFFIFGIYTSVLFLFRNKIHFIYSINKLTLLFFASCFSFHSIGSYYILLDRKYDMSNIIRVAITNWIPLICIIQDPLQILFVLQVDKLFLSRRL